MYKHITLFGHQFLSYDVLVLIAFIVAAAYIYYALVKLEHFSRSKVLIYLILVYLVQHYGGSTLPGLYWWQRRGTFPGMDFFNKGRYFHSTVLSALIFTILYAKVIRFSPLRLLDHFAIGATIMSAIGRVGCFLSGCCYGKETELPWGVHFPRVNGYVHPTQVYHGLFEALLLTPFLLFLLAKSKKNGTVFWSFVCIYSLFRFLIEFLRTNPQAWIGLTHAQLFSITAYILSSAVLAFRRNK